MSYLDVFIPFIAGIGCLFFPEVLLNPSDASFERKKSLIKKAGVALIGVALVYLAIKLLS